MGQVYRAKDAHLKRDVALKILPDAFATDPDRVARFQREAELLATLNHPNVAGIYGVEQADGTRALVLELVEGPTLADRIAQGPIPVDEALLIARQIADALEAAHERGVIHRDLKPANIKLTQDDKVKVLDFGLAKMIENPVAPTTLSMSPTLSVHATYAGVILGTAAYMSPEQARGKPVDKRTDIWAFGCVVFEMLTGAQTFDPGDSVSDAIAAILKNEPEWSRLPPNTPPGLQRLLRRCLQKDPQKRLRDIGDARLEIEDGFVTAAGATAALATREAPQPRLRRVMPATASALLTAAIAGGAWWFVRSQAPAQIVTRFAIALPEGQAFTNTGRQAIAISPDGTQIAYVANARIFVREMGALDARSLFAATGTSALTNPVFSPDGRAIAFYSAADTTIKKISVSGGPSVTIGSFQNPYGVFWAPDRLVVSQGGRGILSISPDGGESQVITKANDDELLYGPQVLPGGKAMIFTSAKIINGTTMALWDKAEIVVQPLPSGDRKTLLTGGSDARYLPSGHLVYAVNGVLFAVPFDVRRLAISGRPVPILEGVSRSAGAATGAAHLSVSENGTLVFLPGPVALGGRERQLAIFDRKGGGIPLMIPTANVQHPRVSPDGKRIVFFTDDEKEAVVWTYELSGATAMRRITFGGNSRFPIFSGDGQYIVFQSDREGDLGIFRQRTDGTGTAERLTRAAAGIAHIPESWSPKGDGLLFREVKGARHRLMFYAAASRQVAQFGGVEAGTPTAATFSPDGRWVAYRMAIKRETGDRSTCSRFQQPARPTSFPSSRPAAIGIPSGRLVAGSFCT